MFEEIKGESSLSLYDQVIIKNLGEIPKVYGNYKLSEKSTYLYIDNDDLNNFKKIYNLSPPKKGKTEGNSKGSGNGEIALYWLFHHQKNSIPTIDARSGGEPDLIIGGNSCEVKAYNNHDVKLKLGYFSADIDSIKMLNIIFGFYSLISIVNFKPSEKKRDKQVNSTNFNGNELLDAFNRIYLFVFETQNKILSGIFLQIRNNINALLEALGNPKTSEEATSIILINLIKTKLAIKPGNNGYLANIRDDNNIIIFKIDFERLNNLPVNILTKNISVHLSTLHINFKNLFF